MHTIPHKYMLTLVNGKEHVHMAVSEVMRPVLVMSLQSFFHFPRALEP